jgi:hypothetical protein
LLPLRAALLLSGLGATTDAGGCCWAAVPAASAGFMCEAETFAGTVLVVASAEALVEPTATGRVLSM